MLPDARVLPTEVRSAQAAIQVAAAHFALLPRNFPREAVATVTPLHNAAELILRFEVGNAGAQVDAVGLIDRFEGWTKSERRTMHWLRKKRNTAVHRGEIEWEQRDEVIAKLRLAFPLVGRLYESAAHSIRDHFSPMAAALLLGLPIPWSALARTLSESAVEYAKDDPEIAVELANDAFVIAVRGFAECWRIGNSSTLPLADLLEAMWAHPDENAHPHYWDERIYDDRDRYRSLGDAPETTLSPPMSLPEIPSLGRRENDLALNAAYYAQEIREIVLSYLDRFPLLDLEDCLKHSWNEIVLQMRSVAPAVSAPLTDASKWNPHVHFFGGKVRVQIPDSTSMMGTRLVAPSSIWGPEQINAFVHFLEERCGLLPLDASL